MNILVISKNEKDRYSGGRYHGWLLSIALSLSKNFVTYLTNNKPIFHNDTKNLINNEYFNIELTKNFLPRKGIKYDIVLLIPDYGRSFVHYINALYLSIKNNSKLVLLNFETPNWFNKYSIVKRNKNRWFYWKLISWMSDLIISSTREGDKYARQYFSNKFINTKFHYHYPPINSFVADLIPEIKKENQIICITRFSKGDIHKGGNDIMKIINDNIHDYTIKFITNVNINSGLFIPIKRKCEELGINVGILSNISDREKFIEIKRSKLMIFLSHFEGFGYPPVEALYCNTPCIVYDLPVFREVSGEGLIYSPKKSKKLQDLVDNILKRENKTEKQKYVYHKVNIFENSKTINCILEKLVQSPEHGIKSKKIINYSKLFLIVLIILVFNIYILFKTK